MHYHKNTPKGNKKPVVIDGTRSAFVKSFGMFEDVDTLELYSRVVDSLLRKVDIDENNIDELSCGVVIPQLNNPNLGRDTAINLGLPAHVHGYSLNRACTSSLQTIADAARKINFGETSVILAGGIDILSDVPITYTKKAQKFLVKLGKSRSATERLNILKNFSAKSWLPKLPSLSEPLTGLTMGEHAEIMAKLNKISRTEQDEFAVRSHKNAKQAQDDGYFKDEITPIWVGNKYKQCVITDNIVRADTSTETLAKLKPAFDRKFGSLTAGNASALTDGASVTMIADEKYALSLGLNPKARIVDMTFVGVNPYEQLLIGPAIAIPHLLRRNKLKFEDIDLFEIHEAFAAQVLSCIRSMESKEFMDKHLNTKNIKEFPINKLNIKGGALAIGHPFGATGSRLVTTMSRLLQAEDKKYGIISICAAGGMAGAMLLERI